MNIEFMSIKFNVVILTWGLSSNRIGAYFIYIIISDFVDHEKIAIKTKF